MENPKMGTVIIGGMTTFITIIVTILVDRFGRKILLLGSITGQLIASMVIGGVLVSTQMKVFHFFSQRVCYVKVTAVDRQPPR